MSICVASINAISIRDRFPQISLCTAETTKKSKKLRPNESYIKTLHSKATNSRPLREWGYNTFLCKSYPKQPPFGFQAALAGGWLVIIMVMHRVRRQNEQPSQQQRQQLQQQRQQHTRKGGWKKRKETKTKVCHASQSGQQPGRSLAP